MSLSRIALSMASIAVPAAFAVTFGVAACGSSDQSTFADGDPNNPNGGGGLGGPTLGGGDGGGPCTNLECNRVNCGPSSSTTVTGTIYDPAGKNPLFNAIVYVPNTPVAPMSEGASCDKCGTIASGSPITTAITDAAGRFTLKDVPVGSEIPLVIQIGKWRRQVTVPTVTACQETKFANADLTRLPKNHKEGDIPNIAVSTGHADSLECLLRRVGIDASEYTSTNTGTNRIHIFEGNGYAMTGGSPKSQKALWSDKASLMKYDIVLLSCEGAEHDETKGAPELQALVDYAAAGGRVFASHFHYYWLNHGAFGGATPPLANWSPGTNSMDTISGDINTSFPKGIAFNDWLKNVKALQPDGTLEIQDAKHNADVNPAVHTASQPWISDHASKATQYFTFNTPLGKPADQQCGRVVFSDLHVGAASNDYDIFAGSTSVPEGCTDRDLSAQEKALEFMLFDLSSCVQSDDTPPIPPPVR